MPAKLRRLAASARRFPTQTGGDIARFTRYSFSRQNSYVIIVNFGSPYMYLSETSFSVVNMEGSVMIYDREYGWVRARVGMALSATSGVTIKTGRDGRVVIVNGHGEFMAVPPCTTRTLGVDVLKEDKIPTLRKMRISRPRSIMRQRVVPAT